MRPADVIAIKRDGHEWTREQIEHFVLGYVTGDVADYQMAAWLMAVCIRGMTAQETADLTQVMAQSGDLIDLSSLGERTADKHSSGGVGDKTSLLVGPIAAACGVLVAKMSGRGLAHTGGTIDKLESIPGFRTDLSLDEFFSLVRSVGVVIAGQTANLAPADKKMYALRDVTGTVPSIPLIASSIMSKKIASGAHNIVLDVKMGKGAFMSSRESAIELARAMVSIGRQLNRRVVTVITDMNQPLGCAVGNALEVIEASDTLRGRGPDDLLRVSEVLSSEMVRLALGVTMSEAEERVRKAVDSGAAYAKFEEWIRAQGGACGESGLALAAAPVQQPIRAERAGYVSAVNALVIGQAAAGLGAGRAALGELIDHRVGVVLHARPGDAVKVGQRLATLHAADDSQVAERAAQVIAAYSWSESPVDRPVLIHGRVDEDGHVA